MKLGKKLKRLREKSHLSQTDVAEKLNISRQAISRWEKGTSTPDIDNLILLSDLYNFNLDKTLNDNVSWKEKISNEFKNYGNSRLESYLLIFLSCISFLLSPIGIITALIALWANKKNNTFHKIILVICIIAIIYNVFCLYLFISDISDWGTKTSVTS